MFGELGEVSALMHSANFWCFFEARDPCFGTRYDPFNTMYIPLSKALDFIDVWALHDYDLLHLHIFCTCHANAGVLFFESLNHILQISFPCSDKLAKKVTRFGKTIVDLL